jgi:hypothetical protein
MKRRVYFIVKRLEQITMLLIIARILKSGLFVDACDWRKESQSEDCTPAYMDISTTKNPPPGWPGLTHQPRVYYGCLGTLSQIV